MHRGEGGGVSVVAGTRCVGGEPEGEMADRAGWIEGARQGEKERARKAERARWGRERESGREKSEMENRERERERKKGRKIRREKERCEYGE